MHAARPGPVCRACVPQQVLHLLFASHATQGAFRSSNSTCTRRVQGLACMHCEAAQVAAHVNWRTPLLWLARPQRHEAA
jgi:hypothetical protein